MEKTIIVKNVIGTNFSCQDAILLRGELTSNSLENDVVLDFSGIKSVPTTFFYNLFSELLYINSRKYLLEHVKVKNLSNIEDYNKVIRGTTLVS